jgi:hypothetical protein
MTDPVAHREAMHGHLQAAMDAVRGHDTAAVREHVRRAEQRRLILADLDDRDDQPFEVIRGP